MLGQELNEVYDIHIKNVYNINKIFSNKQEEYNIPDSYYIDLLLSNVNYYKELFCKKSNWELLKKLINGYELLNVKNNSIVNYKPLSRSFYKLWEIIYDNNIVNINKYKYNNKNKKLNIFCIAEAPGGFIDAFSKYFYSKDLKNYFIDGISLIEKDTNIPTWYNIYNKIKTNPNINIIDEIDGDLYKLRTIKYCVSKGRRYDIITADGGFDFSDDFSNQELQFSKLFFCEILTAISLQNIGGIFICKCFDMNTNLTKQILYILYCLYESIEFVKPCISRDTNSEKYIIARNFKGIKYHILNKLYNILRDWDNNISINFNIPFNIPIEYYYEINKINEYYLKEQYKYYKIIYNLDKILDEKIIKNIIKEQIDKCVLFCNKYNLMINNNSDYIKYPINSIYNKYYKKMLLDMVNK